jgi:hypothetical protein
MTTTTTSAVTVVRTLLTMQFNMEKYYCKYTSANPKNKELFPPALAIQLEPGYMIVDFLNSIFSFFTEPGNFPPT